MALVEQEEKKKGPSLIAQAAAFLAVTALAIGMGWFAGSRLEAERPADPEPRSFRPESRQAEETASADEAEQPDSSVLALDAITTNLADPTDVWVRVELVAVFDGPADPALARAVHQDLFAYLRALKLKQIESASGFQHLKEDLRERARIRSDGRVTDILIQTFIYE
ncbi:flagellar basal body-associated FliL family protein [Chelativorans sp. SCAU2101]|uniref:Flagellar protein FliL n=1 Tax=Chelativorans petroleitrophicus TaxID=2975484 RepID=A0A9X3B5J3_9HYPH|nr:flagellar basal body-associated FliL family protein [Chelativorans petroleitrophicus]MCT8989273.1 flagellar basal body-associated FliL family protein [Chelativorans petroleitrophicus]